LTHIKSKAETLLSNETQEAGIKTVKYGKGINSENKTF